MPTEIKHVRGAVGFALGSSWIARTIAWFTKSSYSHTFVGIRDGEGKGFLAPLVFEADTKGVEIETLYDYAKKAKLTAFYEPIGIRPEIVDAALALTFAKYHHAGYGYFQLIFFAVVLLLRRIGIKIRNWFGGGVRGGIICSELVWEYFGALGFTDLYDSIDHDTVSPVDVEEALKLLCEQGHFRKIDFTLEDGAVILAEHSHDNTVLS